MAASASARDEVELECGDISALQEDLLARSSFLSGGGREEEEPEVFSTPPLTQGERAQGKEEEEEEQDDAITMGTLPFTQSPSPSLSTSEGHGEEALTDSRIQPRKPRVCMRKVRGARIRTPSPSPDRRNTDPLYRAVLMIPTTTTTSAPAGDLLVLARQRGIFF